MSTDKLPGPDDYKKLLLRSAAVLDRPSASSRRRVMTAMGFGLPLTFASFTSALAKASPIWIKPLLGGVMLGAVVVSSVEVVEHVTDSAPRRSTLVSPSHQSKPNPRADSNVREGPPVEPTPPTVSSQTNSRAPAVMSSRTSGTLPDSTRWTNSRAPAAAVPGAPRKKTPRSVMSAVPISPPASPSVSHSLEPSTPSERPKPAGPPAPMVMRELSALDTARQRLAHGDPAGTLRLLDQYARDNPHGLLQEEAIVVRIEALARQGKQGAARALAATFLQTHPASPYADRVRMTVK